MKNRILCCAAVLLGLVLGGLFTMPQGWTAELGPKETVDKHLSALKDNLFEDAFDYISKGFADGQTKQEWADSTRELYTSANVKVMKFTLYPAKIEDDTAIVPNILNASDMFNKEGSIEYELYHLVNEDGVWKVDRQELLFEDSQVKEWFPDVK
ncbi:MAG: hypothetical protein J4G10_05680 [Alphaproteobacteria bacterium]|nr:hypothetical protein [Alphaproteobacteria bacterium]